MSGMKRMARVLETLVIAGCVLLLAYLACLSQGRGWHWRDGEAKQGLHEIQLAVEQYAVDHDGFYPLYLAGGDARWSAKVDVNNRRAPFADIEDSPDKSILTDPLLRDGIITSYPRNPFAKNGAGMHQAQLMLPLNSPDGDPLRNGKDAGRLYGTRFGADCRNMGQVLGAKYYFRKRASASDPPLGSGVPCAAVLESTIPALPPGADTTYRCWNIWWNDHARNPLPGQFIYTATRPLTADSDAVDTPTAEQLLGNESSLYKVDFYSLAVFGSPTMKGLDRLGASGVPWSPLKLGDAPNWETRLGPWCPDGIDDGILQVISPGYGLPY